MSTPGLAQIWSLGASSPPELPRALNFDVWAANQIPLCRVGANALAHQLTVIPDSETRLREEGIIPYYNFTCNLGNVIKSSAHPRGLAAAAIPDAPAVWSEDVSTDHKALAAQFHPHLAGPAQAVMGWHFGLRERDPEPHWTSVVAGYSVVLDMFVAMMPAVSGVMTGSEWAPFVAQMTSDDLKGITNVIREEILRIRAQPGSGWNEEEAKALVQEQLGLAAGMMTVGT